MIERAKMETETHSNRSVIQELYTVIYKVLENYSNVHRGSGHFSRVSTQLYEESREIVLDYLHLSRSGYQVIFCTPHRAGLLTENLPQQAFKRIGSQEIGLPLGVETVAVRKSALKKLRPVQPGGGTTKMVSPEWIIWADLPDRFEPGTPAIVNVIAFAHALKWIRNKGISAYTEKDRSETAQSVLDLGAYASLEGVKLLTELRKSLIGRNSFVPTVNGRQRFINFDNSASTPTFEPIWDAVRKAFFLDTTEKDKLIRETKHICSRFFNAPLSEYEILFVSNTTEAVNTAAENIQSADGKNQVVLTTLLEHSSNDLPWRDDAFSEVIRLPIDKKGFINIEELESTLKSYNELNEHGSQRIGVVAVNGASNVLGVCNDIYAIGQIVKKYDVEFLVDGAQLVAHQKVDVSGSNADYFAFSAHKIYAPFGTGVLIARKSLLNDGDQLEAVRSSGEENLAGIAALGAALLLMEKIGMDVIHADEQQLTRRILEGIKPLKDLRIYGIRDPESKEFRDKLGVIPFTIGERSPKGIADKLALYGGIGTRYGCHCAHMLVKNILDVGPKLEQFQRIVQLVAPKLKFQGVVRVSLGLENTMEDVEMLISTLTKIANKEKQEVVKTKKEVKSYIDQCSKEVFDSV